MRKMVQGTEHEYTLYCRKMGTMGFDPHMMALDLLRDSDLHLAGEFITNGSRVYYDVGHFEVSTAETTNFHDVVICEQAGLEAGSDAITRPSCTRAAGRRPRAASGVVCA